MIQRETSRYISSHTVVEGIKHHVVEPLAEKATEQVHSVVNDVVNDQVGIMASIPGQLGEIAVKGAGSLAGKALEGAGSLAQGAGSLAGRGAEGAISLAGKGAEGAISLAAKGVEGAGSLAGKALEGAGSLAQGAAEGLAARAEKIRQINPENVKESARYAAESASAAADTAMHAARRFGSSFKSRFFGGSRKGIQTRGRKITRGKTRGKSFRGSRASKGSRRSGVLISSKIPVFSILTKSEQKVFDNTVAGKRLKQLEQMIDTIDYSKIQPNPELFSTIRFVLNVAERLFPIFVQELDKTVKLCKMMERQHIHPVSNPYFLKQLGTIVSMSQ
jgi:hypothetical protein